MRSGVSECLPTSRQAGRRDGVVMLDRLDAIHQNPLRKLTAFRVAATAVAPAGTITLFEDEPVLIERT